VSNPPYIAEDDSHLQQGDVRFEPKSALVSGSDGLDDIRTICQQAFCQLVPGGYLMIEHGYDQADQVADIFKQQNFRQIEGRKDLSGNDRITFAVKPW
jgi:release factor glutamine methyltransferase